jgi:hypothetical protein
MKSKCPRNAVIELSVEVAVEIDHHTYLLLYPLQARSKQPPGSWSENIAISILAWWGSVAARSLTALPQSVVVYAAPSTNPRRTVMFCGFSDRVPRFLTSVPLLNVRK